MKKTTIIAALFLVMILFVSCPGNEQESPIPEEPTRNPSGNGIAGLTALQTIVPSVEDLEEGESFFPADYDTSISGFEGRWVAVYIETHISPKPKYAKKVTEELVIVALTGESTSHFYTTTYTYDYSAAIADLGESYWDTIKTDFPETEYTVSGYVATQTSGYTNGCSDIGDIFDDFWNPGRFTVNVNNHDKANVTKIKVYDSLLDDTKIFVKQNQQN
ncbi:MAG: hypothetical protein KBT02_11550 [Treponema sp.]|nr:hypothetical protein [Candidatus Treponema caballi]